MFGSNNKKNQSNGTSEKGTSNPNALNSIVSGTKIEGNITSENDIRVDGILTGSLNANGKVIIGPQGRVDGDINCEQAVVEGGFDGTLKVKDTLQVKESARIQGDVETEKLVVQAGAIFNVTCTMGKQIVREKSSEQGSSKLSKEQKASTKANS